jgi:hypothetical protein
VPDACRAGVLDTAPSAPDGGTNLVADAAALAEAGQLEAAERLPTAEGELGSEEAGAAGPALVEARRAASADAVAAAARERSADRSTRELHDPRAAVVTWRQRYGQRAWLRQLVGPADDGGVTREMEDAVLRTVPATTGGPSRRRADWSAAG